MLRASPRLKRWLVRGPFFAVGGWVAVVGVMLLNEDYLVYTPSPAAWSWQKPKPEVREFDLPLGDDRWVTARVVPSESATAWILFCHGKTGNISTHGRHLPRLTCELGMNLLIFDYPGFGKSPGPLGEEQCYLAATSAFDWLTQVEGVPAERVLIVGESLGGGVATELALRRPNHRALVLLATFANLPDVGAYRFPFVPTHALMKNRFDNASKLPRLSRPVFIAHGEPDYTVPFSHAGRLFAVAPEPRHLCVMAGRGHDDPLPMQFFDELEQFLAKQAPLKE